MNTDTGALLKLADELAVLKEAVCDTRYSAAAVGLRVRNTWSTYEAGLLALRQAASQGSAGYEYTDWTLHKQPEDQIVDHRFSIWSGEHLVVLANETPGEEGALAYIVAQLNGVPQSAPPLRAPQNSAERLPSSDAAGGGAGTLAQAVPEPFAWRWNTRADKRWRVTVNRPIPNELTAFDKIEPLYTSPVPSAEQK